MIRKVEVIYISIGTKWLGFPGGTVVKNLPAMQETQEMQVHLVRETPGGGHGNQLLYSCLENPVTEEHSYRGLQSIESQSQTRLQQLITQARTH